MICTTEIISSAGLVLDIVGAMVVFFHTPDISYETYIYNSSESKELTEKARRKNRWAKVGLLLLAIGFALQLISNWI